MLIRIYQSAISFLLIKQILIQCKKYGLLIVLIILTRQEFLYIPITINLAYIQVLNLEQGLQERLHTMWLL
jgi:hypothetical protein